jgi:hypothetical protein
MEMETAISIVFLSDNKLEVEDTARNPTDRMLTNKRHILPGKSGTPIMSMITN